MMMEIVFYAAGQAACPALLIVLVFLLLAELGRRPYDPRLVAVGTAIAAVAALVFFALAAAQR